MAGLSPAELRKRNNFSLFRTRIASRGDFTLVESNGQKVKIDPTVANTLRSIEDLSQYQQGSSIILPTTMRGEVRLTQLYKDSVFSGRTQNTTAAEDAEVSSIRRKLEQIKNQTGSDFVNLQVGKNSYQVVNVESTPGTPKSDFHFRDVNGNMVGFVSHKDGSSATSIQQWGGITQRGEPMLAAHPETQAFVQTCQAMFGTQMPNATTVARRIQDNRLKMMAVYGNGFGGGSSVQNVDVLLQGTVNVTRTGVGRYKLVASANTHSNGDPIGGAYEPVFMCIYKGDRSNYGIRGARMVISGKGGRSIRQYV
jgi:hypothetical protein